MTRVARETFEGRIEFLGGATLRFIDMGLPDRFHLRHSLGIASQWKIKNGWGVDFFSGERLRA
eukprot:1179062-Prorocentrum_minimum.AAC.3